MYISWLPHLEVEGRWCCYHKSKAANRCSLTPWGCFQTFFMVDIFHVKAYHLQVFFWPYNKVCFLKEIFSCFCGDQNRLYEAKHDVFLTLLLLVADKVWISWWHTKLVPAVYVSLPFAGFSSTKGWLEVLQSLVEEGREVWGNYKSVLFAQRPHFLLDQPSSLCEFSASESPDNYSTRSPCERYSQRLFRCPKGCCARQIHFMIQFKRG